MKWSLFVGETSVANGDAGRDSVTVKVWDMERTESGLEHETLAVEVASPHAEPRIILRDAGVEP